MDLLGCLLRNHCSTYTVLLLYAKHHTRMQTLQENSCD
jgi:hypothetical protein